MSTRTKTVKLTKLLKTGTPARTAARKCKVSRRYVFDMARLHKLPTNPPTSPNGRRERQILSALAVGYTVEQVGTFYSLAPCRIQEIRARAGKLVTPLRKSLKTHRPPSRRHPR